MQQFPPIHNRILFLDGAMGTMIQRRGLSGNSEELNLLHPEVIAGIHREYIDAGARLIETNTFGANRIAQAEYGLSESAAEMALAGARIAREVADESLDSVGAGAGSGSDVELGRVYVAGSVGPTSKSLTLAPDISDPAMRPYSFDEMASAYKEQMEALIDGGVDVILIETCFDAQNAKAALYALSVISEERGLSAPFPAIVSVSVSDRSGRTLTGQTIEAFYNSVRHYPLAAFGINCSLGAEDMIPIVREISSYCEFPVICYPNAGLPNELGGYDETPEEMAAYVAKMTGYVNIVGGCCGTGPEHIRAIASALGISSRDVSSVNVSGSGVSSVVVSSADVSGPVASREIPSRSNFLKVSGLEAVDVDLETRNFMNVGERTNVAGSRKFARLIASGDYESALQVAADQIDNGASIIDINMDDAMLDSAVEMEKFVRWTQNDPAVAKAALMIDSSHWETVLAGLKSAQGKCIVNSISLKDGEAEFVRKAREILKLGAAVVVMAFDEEGQATDYERKVSICFRAYNLLISIGFAPQDIIFDVNVLSVGTGIAEHSRYAVDFIEAVRWIKANLPGARTSGGISNLSFAFRGNNTVREAMHSVFLYYAIGAGLDMAIVNPGMLQVYDEIEPELRKCVEDVILDSDEGATERLIAKAQEIMGAASGAVSEAASGAASASGASPASGALGGGVSGLVSGSAAGSVSGSIASGSAVSGSEITANPETRLSEALVKGRTAGLAEDVIAALETLGSAVAVIEGPLMAGMERVGELFGAGKMFLPQVVKSAKVMRDAVAVLEPYMESASGVASDVSQVDASMIASDGVSGMTSEEGAGMASDGFFCEVGRTDSRPVIVNATVKGDVHDIGKNITGIVLTCNGFNVIDLGVMVDKETILNAAVEHKAAIVGVSGLITPSLYQMEEICREMAARGMTIPLFIGGATTSALHTAVKLAPLYNHVFYSPDASASAVMAKKYMMDPEGFEYEEHRKQERIRELHSKKVSGGASGTVSVASESADSSVASEIVPTLASGVADSSVVSGGASSAVSENPDFPAASRFPASDYLRSCPFPSHSVVEVPLQELLPFFDWKMFLAVWGVKYGSADLADPDIQKTLKEGREVLENLDGKCSVKVSMRFFEGCSDGDVMVLDSLDGDDGCGVVKSSGCCTDGEYAVGGNGLTGRFEIPMLREADHLSLCDFLPAKSLGFKSPLGIFAVSVQGGHPEGCHCEACHNEYGSMMLRSVKVTLAEAASEWIDSQLIAQIRTVVGFCDSLEVGSCTSSDENVSAANPGDFKIIKPAVGYASCPDHTLKRDILELLPDSLGITLTESCAMIPDASICGFILAHKKANYPAVTKITQEQLTRYAALRGLTHEAARRFLGHLL